VDWSDLQARRFTPADAERLAGESPLLQRKWVQLHFSRLSDSAWLWTDRLEGSRRQFTWAGIQMLAFFRDVTRDVGSDGAVHGFMHAAKRTPIRSG
jgi:hypothetical protein